MSTRLRFVELESGKPSDIGIVDALMIQAFDPRYGEAWTRAQCLGILSMPGVALTIARVDGAAAGFALTRTVLDEVELLLLAVTPQFRRRGVARALLNGFLADARGRGLKTAHLEVRAGNPAVALYTAAGFAKRGERRAYYRGNTGEVFDAHSYTLNLA
ncbi:Ribosomal-protein-alanine N-acetyltransferase [Sphingomonas sp. EC-HK361]|jgi:ribosomal-protein-alanine N-acetyltransferase|uniref:GNAT family N-acetyltransferase n=1 Tax=Sphingomonas sp. EC-HK361 TaxID=2038397 RepID=UPI00125BFAF3|nr:GNAT family N-acetyltransferase [Sphingomonas sp. EC-HK361]VVT13130.1 Ribosomal-protein-alanine N-acetyltransferase [Sphingomonas sp. EC-HK361]